MFGCLGTVAAGAFGCSDLGRGNSREVTAVVSVARSHLDEGGYSSSGFVVS